MRIGIRLPPNSTLSLVINRVATEEKTAVFTDV